MRVNIGEDERITMRKLDYQFVKEFFKINKYILVEDNYKNSTTKLKVICPKNHEIEVTFGGFKSGRRCMICSGNKKLTHKEVKNYIELESKSGCTLISEKYKHANEKLEIQCNEGHTFMCTWSNFKSKGTRCAKCKGLARLTLEEVRYYIEIESNSGYKLISNEYKNNTTKLTILCNEGHIYLSHFSNFKDNKARCPQCHLLELSKKMTGAPKESHPSWKPELSDEDREYKRNIIGYKEWVLDIFKRDNFICQCCNLTKTGSLNAHHLDSYDWCKGKRTDLDNGVTLCEACHKDFHRSYGYGKNTREQFEEWIKNYQNDLLQLLNA